MKNKYSTENFLKLAEEAKNILDRLYNREDFNKDIKSYRRTLKIPINGFGKLEALDIRDPDFAKKVKGRRKKHGSVTIINTAEERIWSENLTDKQSKLLSSIGKKLQKKYQQKVDFELPDFIEDYILQYLLYNIRSYRVRLYAPEVGFILDKNDKPIKINVVKYPSTSARDEQYMKALEKIFKEKLPKFIKSRQDKTLKLGRKILKIDKEEICYFEKTDRAFGDIDEVVGLSNPKDFGKEEKKRHNRFRTLKSRTKKKLGIK